MFCRVYQPSHSLLLTSNMYYVEVLLLTGMVPEALSIRKNSPHSYLSETPLSGAAPVKQSTGLFFGLQPHTDLTYP